MAQEIICRNSGAISNVVDAHHGTSILAPLGGQAPRRIGSVTSPHQGNHP